MEICYIDYGFYTPESTLAPLYEYSKILSEKEARVTVFVRSDKRTIKGKANLTVHEVCREYFSSKITHIIFILRLVNQLRKDNFDVVHTFNFCGVSIIPILCRRNAKKWILDIQTGRTEGSSTARFLFDKLTTFESRFFDEIIVLSVGLRDKLFGSNFPNNILIVPIGANIERFNKAKIDRTLWQKYGLPEKCVILIYIGGLGNRSIDKLLRAFQIVLKNNLDEIIRLLIVGGEKEEIIKLRRESERLSISEKVFFLGKMPYEDIPTYLVNADIGLGYVPKNIIHDVQPPLKTLEYLAASLPVVATNTLGNMEIANSGIKMIITSDDYDDFARGILCLIKDRSLRMRLKEENLAMLGEYDWRKITKDLLERYKFLIKR